MKILFITHSSNLIYGASKSLSYILKNTKYEFDLICTKTLLTNNSESQIRAYAGGRLKEIYSFNLPYKDKIVSYSANKLSLYRILRKSLRSFITTVLSFLDSFLIKSIIKKNQYELVHLNSIVLYPLIDSKNKYVVHFREVYNGRNNQMFYKQINKASGYIFIDSATRNAIEYKLVERKNHITLNNPVDMRNLYNYDIMESKKSYGIPEKKVVFTILGNVSPTKGIDFVIRSFLNSSNENSLLFIVGSGFSDYINFCKLLCEQNPNILFIDEIENPEPIFLVSDYIIRADPYFAIGRTVYEGLYSGCEIIIQGEENDIELFFDKDAIKDKIHFYSVRDEKKLSSLLNKLAHKKVQKELFLSNVEDYVIKIDNFFEKVAKSE